MKKVAVVLVFVMIFGMMVVGCDILEDETDKFDPSIIIGDWYLLNYNGDKTGSIITISGNSGILTVIGTDDFFWNNGPEAPYGRMFSEDCHYNLGDLILRNISYIGIREGYGGESYKYHQYWDCESVISNPLTGQRNDWEKKYLSYNMNTKILNIHVRGDHWTGFHYSFKKQ